MALGSRTLLNIVDRAIRDLRREHPEIPDAFNRKTVAHIGREEEAQADSQRAVPEMDRSIARIRQRGRLRVGIHPGVPGLVRSSIDKGECTKGSSRISRGASRSSSSAIRTALNSFPCAASGV